MDCKETLRNLSLLLDGELETALEGDVLSHLHKCWHCSEIKANEAKLKELIKAKLAYKLKTPTALIQTIQDIVLQKE